MSHIHRIIIKPNHPKEVLKVHCHRISSSQFIFPYIRITIRLSYLLHYFHYCDET